MADGTAWRLVSQCATVEDLVRVFRTLASADGLTGIRVSGIGPGGGSQVRVVLALSTKAAVLDGDAVVTRDAGTVSVRWLKLDARGKGLLAHMLEHRDAEAPPAVPRHLIPLGAAAGTSATARGDASMAKCVFEPMGASGTGPRTAVGASTGASAVPDVATTVRMPGARQAAPPTIRESGPPSAMVAAAGAAASPAPASEKPKREAQKTLMGVPTMSRANAAAAAAVAAPAVIAPQPSSGATTTPVVATGTPPIGLDQSVPVPKGGVELKETGPTQPTRGKGVASPAVAAAARAISATPAAPFDNAPTVPTAQGAVRRVEAAPSGPVEDVPTIPNEDIVTDVSVALPDLPSGDYVDPIIEPPAPAVVHSPVPAPPPPAVYAVAGSSPGWQMPPQPPPMQPQAAPPYALPPQPYYPTPYPPQAGVAPMMIERDDDMTEMVQLVRPGGRSRWPVIAVTSGVIVVGVAVMVIVAARGSGEKSGTSSPPPPAAKAAAATAPAAGSAAAAGSATAPVAEAGATCKVSFTSSPDAAEVVLGGQVIGTTPFDYDGSCAAYKVTYRRDKYQSQTKEVAAGATTLDVRLERPQFRVKVTSRPPGAMVRVDGKDLGKTPVTIALPGFETTSIELVRGGVTTTQRVYAGKSGQKVDVKLKSRR